MLAYCTHEIPHVLVFSSPRHKEFPITQHISVIEQDKRAPSLSSLAKLAEELGVTVDYIITGKEGVITGTIPAIKADKKLSLQSKRALAGLVEELYRAHGSDRE